MLRLDYGWQLMGRITRKAPGALVRSIRFAEPMDTPRVPPPGLPTWVWSVQSVFSVPSVQLFSADQISAP